MNVLNILGVIIAAWALIYPHPYRLSVTLCALIPLTVMILVSSSPRLIKNELAESRKKPSFTLAVFSTSLALAMRACDYHIAIEKQILIPVLIFILAVMVINMIPIRKLKINAATLIVFVFLSLVYGFGMGLHSNCLFDYSKPEHFYPEVLDKKEKPGRRQNSHYLYLSPWGPRQSGEEVQVRKRFFDSVNKGDMVLVSVKSGSLGVPWFTLSKPRPKEPKP